jgi:hypothetical protein
MDGGPDECQNFVPAPIPSPLHRQCPCAPISVFTLASCLRRPSAATALSPSSPLARPLSAAAAWSRLRVCPLPPWATSARCPFTDARATAGSCRLRPTPPPPSVPRRLRPDSTPVPAHRHRHQRRPPSRHSRPSTPTAGPLPRADRHQPPCSFVKGFFSSVF